MERGILGLEPDSILILLLLLLLAGEKRSPALMLALAYLLLPDGSS